MATKSRKESSPKADAPEKYVLPDGHVLVLRSCNPDRSSKNGFVWPESGPVECPDWEPRAVCGNGLHGLLLGQQDPGVWYENGAILVVEVAESDALRIENDVKVKFPKGDVVYCGDMAGASEFFARHNPGGAEGLYRRVAQGGYGSTLTGGDRSTLTGGYGSTLTGGYGSTLTGGYGSTLTGGDRSTLTGGYGSTLVARWWDGERVWMKVHYVGEDGIEPNVAYRAEKGELIRIQAETSVAG